MGTSRQKKNREDELKFAKSIGESKLGQVRAARGREGKSMVGIMTKNERFKKYVRGAAPMEDSKATGSKVAHVGLRGAPNIYREDPGGRKGKRGKRG